MNLDKYSIYNVLRAGEPTGTPAVTPPVPAPVEPAAPAAPPAAAPVPQPPEAKPPGETILGAKPVEEKPAEPAKPEGAPEKYTDFTLPEGAEVNAELMSSFKDLAKANNLPQAAAQQLVEFHVSALKQVADRADQLWADANNKWVDEVKADPEIGGANLEKVKTTIAKAFDQFGDPNVRDALEFTGAGNHPAIIRTLYKMASKLVEGAAVTGNPPAAQRTLAERIYGTAQR